MRGQTESSGMNIDFTTATSIVIDSMENHILGSVHHKIMLNFLDNLSNHYLARAGNSPKPDLGKACPDMYGKKH